MNPQQKERVSRVFLISALIFFSFLSFPAQAENQDVFSNKFIVIMGDSFTTPEMWPQTMIRTYLPNSAKVINTAVGGSAWGMILDQWDLAKKQLPAGRQPDIVIITTGGNRFPDSKYGYDDVIELCLGDSAPKDSDDQMIVAARSLRRIIADGPASDIYLWKWGTPFTFAVSLEFDL